MDNFINKPLDNPTPRGPDIEFGADPSAWRNSGRSFTQVGTDGQITTGTPGGESYNSGVSRVDTTAQDAWKLTGLNNYGSPVMKLDLNTTVEIDGVRSDVKSFIAAGMLAQLPDGHFARPVHEHNGPAPDPAGAYQAIPDASTIPEEVENAMTAALSSVHPSTVESALHLGANLAADINFSDESLLDIAKQLAATGEMDLAEAQQQTRNIHAVFVEDAKRAVLGAGVHRDDFDGFMEFVRGSHQRELRDAMNEQLFSRKTGGYRALAERFLRDVAPRDVPGAVTRSAFGGPSRQLVTIHGVEMDVGTAAKLGLIG